MRQRLIFLGIVFFCLSLVNSSVIAKDFPALKGPYLGQKLPGTTPEIFAPGIISTGMDEATCTFGPNMKECYYTVNLNGIGAIMVSRVVNGCWTAPEVAPFSGKYVDADPCIQPDGLKLYFISNRPLDSDSKPSTSHNMWVIEKVGTRWGEPRPVGSPINGHGSVFGPSMSKNGVLYFSRDMEGGWTGIFCSKYVDGKFTEPEKLPDTVNSTNQQFHSWVSPDDSFLIVSVFGRKDTVGSTDYYVSFKNSRGEWSQLINLGNTINSAKPEFSPSLSPDGKYFFYQSNAKRFKYFEKPLTYSGIKEIFNGAGNGNCDIYWVDVQVILNLKPKE